MREEGKIVFFVGGDIMAHLIMNKVVKWMCEDPAFKSRYKPVLYFPEYPQSKRETLPELQEFSYYEKGILKSVVYPLIENNKSFAAAPNHSPQQLAEIYNLEIANVRDVNDPEFVQSLKDDDGIVASFSVRCFQIFKQPLIDILKKDRLFLNLHPGLLPEYRGVMSTARRMFEIASGAVDGNDYGFFIHKVNEEIDGGKIVTYKSIPLNREHSNFAANIALVDGAAETLVDIIRRMSTETFCGYPQDTAKQRYFTYPTAEELQEWKKCGVEIFRPEEVVDTIINAFCREAHPHREQLKDAIQKAIERRSNNGNGNGKNRIQKDNHGQQRDTALITPQQAANQSPIALRAAAPSEAPSSPPLAGDGMAYQL